MNPAYRFEPNREGSLDNEITGSIPLLIEKIPRRKSAFIRLKAFPSCDNHMTQYKQNICHFFRH